MDNTSPIFDQTANQSRLHLPPAPSGRLKRDLDILRSSQRDIPSNPNGPPRLPIRLDFSPSISLVISQNEPDEPIEHVIIYLHQHGENETSLEPLARKLKSKLKRSAYILIQGIEPVAIGSNSYHWADPQSQWDEGFLNASHSLLIDVIKDVLISRCNFMPSNIMIIGHCQGGMAALATVASWNGVEFGGVISIGGPLPSYVQLPLTVKAKTPALILRAVLGDVHPEALKRIRDTFVTIDVVTREGAHDTIPGQDALRPILEFFAHRFHQEEWEKQAILSFDGGGVRGLGSLLILQELMNKVGDEEKRIDREDGSAESSFSPCLYMPRYPKRIPTDSSEDNIPSATNLVDLPNSSLYLPCHYFTYVAGTSTGGLISIMLSRFRMTVDDCIVEYKSLGEQIFGRPRPMAKGAILWHKFSAEVLEQVIKDVTSRHSEARNFEPFFASDEDLCRTVVYAYADHFKSDIPYAFRTYLSPRPRQGGIMKNYGDAPNLPIWQVARATSAAHGYFRPFELHKGDGSDRIRFKNGGFETNNPTKEAYYDVVDKHGKESKIGLVISIGTGKTPARRPGHRRNAIANFIAASKMPSRNLKVHHDMMQLADKHDEEQFQYYRFEGGEALGQLEIDKWEKEGHHFFPTVAGRDKGQNSKTSKEIEIATAAYLQSPEVQHSLVYCAKLLVRRRRLRTRDISKWDRYASASYYVCELQGCEGRRINTSQEFEVHIKNQHDIIATDSVLEERRQSSRHCWIYGEEGEMKLPMDEVQKTQELDLDDSLSTKGYKIDENRLTENENGTDESTSSQNFDPDEDHLMKEFDADENVFTKEGADVSSEDGFDPDGGVSPEESALDQLKNDVATEEPSSAESMPANELNQEAIVAMQAFDLTDPLSRIVHVNQVTSTTDLKKALQRPIDAFTDLFNVACIKFSLLLLVSSSKIADCWNRCWEPSLTIGKTRIRWTCQCGKMLWDDFEELRPGAAETLQRDLDSYKRASVSKPHRSTNQAAESNSSQIPPSVSAPASSRRSTFRSFFSHSLALVSSTFFGSNPGTLRGSIASATTSTTPPGSPPTLYEENYLLLCSSKPNDTLRLSQLYVGNINDDVRLFQRLNEVYTENRGKLACYFSLRKIRSINFRKFERHPYDRVVILDCPNTDILPRRTNPRACHRQHTPPRCNTAYDIDPTPPDLTPYVGRNGLEHLLKHPHEAADEGNNLPIQDVWLKRFPKKKTKLKPCPIHKIGYGWGIEFEKDLDIARVMAVIMVFILAAIIFLISWWKIHGDLQGATGMGSLLLGLPALFFTAFSVSQC